LLIGLIIPHGRRAVGSFFLLFWFYLNNWVYLNK
jgi:hypothetical protein